MCVMDTLRKWIGMGPPPSSSSGSAGGGGGDSLDAIERKASADAERARLIKTQKLQLRVLADELAEVELDLKQALEEKNRAVAKVKLSKQRELQHRISQLQGMVSNQTSQDQTLQAARSNLKQATLMQDAAEELESVVDETERIDLDDVVDRFQDGAALTDTFSDRLSEPLLQSAAGFDVDDELDALMNQAEDERVLAQLHRIKEPEPTHLAMPNTSGGGGGGGGNASPLLQQQQQQQQRAAKEEL